MRYRLRELMVLAAVGPPLLAGMVWFVGRSVITCRNYPRTSARYQLDMLEEAVLAYSMEVGRLPRDLTSLLVVTPDLSNNEVVRWRGPYLDKTSLPIDSWDREFQYEVLNAKKSRFRICSMGPDRVSGTRDDVVVER